MADETMDVMVGMVNHFSGFQWSCFLSNNLYIKDLCLET